MEGVRAYNNQLTTHLSVEVGHVLSTLATVAGHLTPQWSQTDIVGIRYSRAIALRACQQQRTAIHVKGATDLFQTLNYFAVLYSAKIPHTIL